MVDLAEIEELGALQFSLAEVAIILGREIADGAELTAYRRGQLKAEAEVRASILKLAKSGSSPAQRQFLDLVRDREG